MVRGDDMSKIGLYIDTVLKDGDYLVKFSHLEKICREQGRFYWCFFFIVVNEKGQPIKDYELDDYMFCGLTTNYYPIGACVRSNHQYVKIFRKIARYHGHKDKDLAFWFPNETDVNDYSFNEDSPIIKARVHYQTKGVEGQDIKPISKVSHIYNPERETWEGTLGKSRHYGNRKPIITSLTTAQDLVDEELLEMHSAHLMQLRLDGKITYEKMTEIMDRKETRQ